VSYTISKNLADYQNELESSAGPSPLGRSDGPQNAYNLKAEKGLTNTDSAAAAGVQAFRSGSGRPRLSNHLNSGWSEGCLNSGRLTPSVPSKRAAARNRRRYDTSQTGLPAANGGRIVTVAPNGSSQPTVNRWFDTSVFSEPLPYTFGTCSTSPGPRTPGWPMSTCHCSRASPSAKSGLSSSEQSFLTRLTDNSSDRRILGLLILLSAQSAVYNVPPREIQFSLKFYF